MNRNYNWGCRPVSSGTVVDSGVEPAENPHGVGGGGRKESCKESQKQALQVGRGKGQEAA